MIVIKNKRIILLSLAFTMVINPAVSGQENESKPDYQGQSNLFSLGAGMVITQDPYKGIDTKVRGLPFFFYKTQRLTLYGPMLSYLLYKDKEWELDFDGKIRFEGYEEDDSRFLQGMDDRKWTMELGGSLSKTLPIGKITSNAAADILNEHKGFEFGLFYSCDFRNVMRISSLTLSPDIGFSYRSSRLNNYYYGVRASEAVAGRPEYDVGDSVGLKAGIRLNYMYSDRVSVMGIMSFEWLGDEIRRSPIVEEDYLETFILGIMYRF
ncbi:MAG: MipA/OmpV family protein [Sedimentisphaerales bacterium]|nr:MipA/OmpV family protein [Sedimentisphaerales bacterium]